LKDPHEAFKDVDSSEIITHMLNDKGGICVGDIAKKSGLAQSTTSKYLSDLESNGPTIVAMKIILINYV
jgi:predicted transcriptional regulator